MNESSPSISVVIPTLEEAGRIANTVNNVRLTLPTAEIIVADGGSRDETRAIARRAGARVVTGGSGRGPQCAAGAAEASGELLLFLHADTVLPADAASVLAGAFARSDVQLGTFRLTFDGGGAFLRTCAWFTRFDSVFTRFGDQGIAVRRSFYAELSGFPPWPLFEDVEFLRRARSRTRVWSFPAEVITSARRFTARGAFRQQLQNTRLLLRFLGGASPARLATEYRGLGRERD